MLVKKIKKIPHISFEGMRPPFNPNRQCYTSSREPYVYSLYSNHTFSVLIRTFRRLGLIKKSKCDINYNKIP